MKVTKEKTKEYNQRYKENHKKEIKETNRKYYIKNKEKIKTYNKIHNKGYYQKNKEKLVVYGRNWSRNNKDKIRDYTHKLYLKRRNEAINLLGGKCEKCSIKDKRVLQFHHKNGIKDIIERGWLFKKSYLKQIKNGEFNLLCANCHIIEHINMNYIMIKWGN